MGPRNRTNPLALAVLLCLYERPMHPYEVATTLRQRNKHESVRLNYGSLYAVVELARAAGADRAPGDRAREGRLPERTVYRTHRRRAGGGPRLAHRPRRHPGEGVPGVRSGALVPPGAPARRRRRAAAGAGPAPGDRDRPGPGVPRGRRQDRASPDLLGRGRVPDRPARGGARLRPPPGRRHRVGGPRTASTGGASRPRRPVGEPDRPRPRSPRPDPTDPTPTTRIEAPR